MKIVTTRNRLCLRVSSVYDVTQRHRTLFERIKVENLPGTVEYILDNCSVGFGGLDYKWLCLKEPDQWPGSL